MKGRRRVKRKVADKRRDENHVFEKG